jgi:tripartite-type tricarboxylate transporter receptor subunit TctC
VLEHFVTNPKEVALLNLLNAPQRLGLAVIAPPGLPADITRILRASYLAMVASKDYQAEAAKRGLDVGKPNTGEELTDYVVSKLVTFAPETIREYRDYEERP